MFPAVIIPTYNEIENLPLLLQAILDLHCDVHVIVVDDNSPDGTGQVADKLAETHAEVHVIHRPEKLGLGTAYAAGFQFAMSWDADPILTMDADFSHHPRYIPALLARSQEDDLVIGSRYVPGGGVKGSPTQRRLLSYSANILAHLLLSLKARDCTAGFRAYRRRVLAQVDFESIRANGYSYLIEMLYYCQNAGFQIGEVPIIFEDRQRGTSKISSSEVRRAIGTVLRLALKRTFGATDRPYQQTPEVADNIEPQP